MTKSRQSDGKRRNLDELLDEAIKIASDSYLSQQEHSSEVSLSEELTNLLYQQWYTRSTTEKSIKHLPHASWEEVFRAVHPGTYLWESGWTVDSVSSEGRVIAHRDKQQRVLHAGDYICPLRPGLPAIPGADIEVVARHDSSDQMPGYWISYSSSWHNAKHPILRIYWNIGPEGAVKLAELLPLHLDHNIPYSFKLPVETQGYNRVDVAVLNFEVTNYEQMKPSLKTVSKLMKSHLYPDIPSLTKWLEPGIALAEEPPIKNESFGLNRCRLIAEAYLSSKEIFDQEGNHEFSDHLNVVRNHLFKAGLNLDQPHLNPNSHNEYKW